MKTSTMKEKIPPKIFFTWSLATNDRDKTNRKVHFKIRKNLDSICGIYFLLIRLYIFPFASKTTSNRQEKPAHTDQSRCNQCSGSTKLKSQLLPMIRETWSARNRIFFLRLLLLRCNSVQFCVCVRFRIWCAELYNFQQFFFRLFVCVFLLLPRLHFFPIRFPLPLWHSVANTVEFVGGLILFFHASIQISLLQFRVFWELSRVLFFLHCCISTCLTNQMTEWSKKEQKKIVFGVSFISVDGIRLLVS